MAARDNRFKLHRSISPILFYTLISLQNGFRQILSNTLLQFFSGKRAGLKPFCPGTAGVQTVPERHFAAVTTFARIVVAKTIKNPIPDRLEPFDQQRFRQWKPNIINGQELAIEVFKAKVRGSIHRFCMVIEPLVEWSSRVDIVTLSTFSRTIGYCLAYINGAGKLVVAVNFCKCLICGEIPNIIKCVHSSTNEGLRRQPIDVGL